MNDKLFPQPYLQSGSKGPAVVVLQIMLFLLGYNTKIIVDGDYGEETIIGVQKLQRIAGLEPDGHFGPDTRAAFLEMNHLDVNAIPSLEGETIAPSVEN